MLAGQVGVDMAIYLMAWLKGEGPSVSTMDSTKSLGNSLWPGPQQPQRSDKVLGVTLAGLGMGMA